MRYGFINNFAQVLAADLAAGATTLTLDGGGALLADASTDYRYKLTLIQRDAFNNETAREILEVTGASGDVLTVVREQEGTTAISSWPSGSAVEARVTAGQLAGFAPELIAFGPVDFSDGADSATWSAPAGRKLYVDAIEVVPSASGAGGSWSTPAGTPTLPGNGRAVALNAAGTRLAVGHSTSPFVTVIDTSDWSTITTAAIPDRAYGLDFSPDDSHLAIAHRTSPFLTVLETSGWTAVAGTPTLGGTPYAIQYSPDGTELAVGIGAGSNALEVYTVSTWAVASYLAGDAGNAVNWSPDGAYLAVGHDLTPGLTVFDTGTWAAESGPAMDSITYAVAFSPDSAWLAAGDQAGDVLVIFDASDWSVAATPTLTGASWVASLGWDDATGNLAVGHDGTGYLAILEPGTWATAAAPTVPDTPRALAFNAAGTLLAMATWTSPYLEVREFAAAGAPTLNLGTSAVAPAALLSGAALAAFTAGERIVVDVAHAVGVTTLYAEPATAETTGAPATLIVRGYTLEA